MHCTHKNTQQKQQQQRDEERKSIHRPNSWKTSEKKNTFTQKPNDQRNIIILGASLCVYSSLIEVVNFTESYVESAEKCTMYGCARAHAHT